MRSTTPQHLADVAALVFESAMPPLQTRVQDQGAVVTCGDEVLATLALAPARRPKTVASVKLTLLTRDGAALRAQGLGFPLLDHFANVPVRGRIVPDLNSFALQDALATTALVGPAWRRLGATLLGRVDAADGTRSTLLWQLEEGTWSVDLCAGAVRTGRIDGGAAAAWLLIAAAQNQEDVPDFVLGRRHDTTMDALAALPRPEQEARTAPPPGGGA